MEQEVYAKQQKFEEEYDNFIEKIILCRRIVSTELTFFFLAFFFYFHHFQVSKLTDAVFRNDVRKEAKLKTADEFKMFLNTVKGNLDTFTGLFHHHNNTTANCLTQLESIENDLTLFTYKAYDLDHFIEKTMGECVISNVGEFLGDRCYINDAKK